ncbi:MAG TPA: DUF1836 domain-containing protein [Bacillota bacterium]|nr:DUF1836 domain-containing protein [Bacillota bacterium]
MKNIDELIETLHLDAQLTLEDIPDLHLYMDQVIHLFENKFAGTKRTEDEKVLTKTMINNYAKGKLFFPVKNKKYTREHIMLISMIYQMKSILSINDIKKTLAQLNAAIVEDGFDLEPLYENLLELADKNVERIIADSREMEQEAAKKAGEDNDYLQKLLLIASFTHMSSVYRRMAEKLVDEIEEPSK